jgi:hypothetical protein
MPLDDDTFAPNAQRVLFHLTLFGEFCEDDDAEEMNEGITCECLRDAVEELCRSLATSVLTPEDQCVLGTALHQAEAAFREDMPNLFDRTGAARGFAALLDLVSSAAAPEQWSNRERRSTALGLARRFGRTLGVYAGPREAHTLH